MLRILYIAAALAIANGHKESCKMECDHNFNRNPYKQFPLLAPVCHRGCDMYIVAFISTSANPKTGKIAQEKYADSLQKDVENNSISSPKDKRGSKTTTEPTLQPVQDYPVKISDHITTKTPNRQKLSAGLRKSANSVKVLETAHETDLEENMKEKEKIKQMKIEQAKRTCRHACIIAYGEVSEVEACVVGCNLQSKVNHSQENFENGIGKSAVSSLKNIESSIMNFIGHIGHFVRVSWRWTFPKTKEPVRIQEYGTENAMKPQIVPLLFTGVNLRSSFPKDQMKRTNNLRPKMMHILQAFRSDFALQPDLFENIDRSLNELVGDKLPQQFKHVNSERQFNHYQDESTKEEPKFYLEATDNYEKNGYRAATNYHQKNRADMKWDEAEARQPPWMKSADIKQSLDILECISRKSGLPRWFIAVTMFSSIPVALWLCFSLTAPPDESKVSKTKVVDPDNTLECADIAEEKCRLMQDYDDCVKPKFEIV